MPLSMHAASVPLLTRSLTNLLAWLDKAESHAKARGFEPDAYLGLRLAPDMLPFERQIQIASDAAKGCVARLADVEPPKWPDDETTLDELRTRVRTTIEYVESIAPGQFEGSETRKIVLPLGPERSIEFDGEAFLKTFALPNFFFHVTMSYALLRHAGVALGKMDYLGAP